MALLQGVSPFAELFVFPALRWIVGGVLAIGAFLWWRTRGGRRRAIGATRARADRGASSLDLVVIDLALEPDAAREVRASIHRAVARSVSIESVLREVARAFLLARGGWTHAAVRSWPIDPSGGAEERYRALVNEARARATLEPSAQRDPGPGYRGAPATAGDHTPVVMASLTVCSLDELPEQGGAVADAASAVLLALESLAPQRVYRAELTWLPDSSDEALFAAELVSRHPRLIAIARLPDQSTQPGTVAVS